MQRFNPSLWLVFFIVLIVFFSKQKNSILMKPVFKFLLSFNFGCVVSKILSITPKLSIFYPPLQFCILNFGLIIFNLCEGCERSVSRFIFFVYDYSFVKNFASLTKCNRLYLYRSISGLYTLFC